MVTGWKIHRLPSQLGERFGVLHCFCAGRPGAPSRERNERLSEAGFGAHEVRTWVAAAAAARKMGDPRTELRYYHLVPEWITGMGIVVGQG